MTDDYTPTDAEIREQLLWEFSGEKEQRAGEAFDRWLAAHDAMLLALNPAVVLAALDNILEPMTTHSLTHVHVMQRRVRRLRDQVAEYVDQNQGKDGQQ